MWGPLGLQVGGQGLIEFIKQAKLLLISAHFGQAHDDRFPQFSYDIHITKKDCWNHQSYFLSKDKESRSVRLVLKPFDRCIYSHIDVK